MASAAETEEVSVFKSQHLSRIEPGREADELGFFEPIHSVSDHDFLTIPNYSSWFSWDEIHETEKSFFKEFFDASSPSKTTKLYKEYRDFIISKYREDPTRRLTFTEVRKLLIGDVSLIHKVYHFLETWGLINFQVSDHTKEMTINDTQVVNFEEGVPPSIRVVPAMNVTKQMTSDNATERVVWGFEPPPLASYVDVFGEDIHREAKRRKEETAVTSLACKGCGAECSLSHYLSVKGESILCGKCFENVTKAEEETADGTRTTAEKQGPVSWTDSEMLLLLEGTLKHGDDWDKIAAHVRTKSKYDCILKLIQLPFGEHLLSNVNTKGNLECPKKNASVNKENPNPFLEAIMKEEQKDEHIEKSLHMEMNDFSVHPLKQNYLPSLTDTSFSLMSQVAFLSTIVGPQIAAAAAEVAVMALGNENPSGRELLDSKQENVTFACLNNDPKRVLEIEDKREMNETSRQSGTSRVPSENGVGYSILQLRAAIATALGATAAHAKLLADQEEREIEHLMSICIKIQLKKVQYKVSYFEEVEMKMNEELGFLLQKKKMILDDRILLLQKALDVGFLKGRENDPPR
ncbi:SWI/SNF complex subunit SWI3A [Amborella trichopoda]|uniref:SWIRM domain-containing protein n=1 Tax=Amborella trichopoda TaxID=13333 RepID=W1PF08_AMBTC|nr:SWI/SNF complex subunit SWI3A [Amborella trichopoda]ERN06294.1 hypothetical protein AMTR_s00016p00224780 [Amborella trichopoda]|eukprot:XP_006844619.1 SWI/SNF complex subunit SWI3A [Amborella trichopoda]